MEGCIAEIHNITSLDISDNGKYTEQERRVMQEMLFVSAHSVTRGGCSCFVIIGHVGYGNVSDQDLLFRNVEQLTLSSNVCCLRSV